MLVLADGLLSSIVEKSLDMARSPSQVRLRTEPSQPVVTAL
jgi:hypothetical protein